MGAFLTFLGAQHESLAAYLSLCFQNFADVRVFVPVVEFHFVPFDRFAQYDKHMFRHALPAYGKPLRSLFSHAKGLVGAMHVPEALASTC